MQAQTHLNASDPSAKWRQSTMAEIEGFDERFIDLRPTLSQPTPDGC